MHSILRIGILALLTAIFALSTAQAAGFADVQGTIYEPAVTSLQSAGLVQGYADGTFRPYRFLNRAEAVALVLRAKGGFEVGIAMHKERSSAVPLFVDTDQHAWYAAYLETAFSHGIITGYSDRSFRPGSRLGTAEALALLLRTYGENGQGIPFESATYLANRQNQWYTPYVNVALARNIVMQVNALRVELPITRGQFADMIYRLRVIEQANLAVYTGPKPPAVGSQAIPSSRTDDDIPTRTFSDEKLAELRTHASQKSFAIAIPSIGIADLTITHPQDVHSQKGVLAVLKRGVGHLFSFPGQNGKVMIYGHSSGYPWDVSEYTKVFRGINKVNVGDLLLVTYNEKLYVYQTSRKQTIQATDRKPFQGTGEELILYTCWPPDSITERYLVHGKLLTVLDV